MFKLNEIVSLIKGIPSTQWRAFFAVLYGTACRIGELLGGEQKQTRPLCWRNVEYDKNIGRHVFTVVTEKRKNAPERTLVILEKELDEDFGKWERICGPNLLPEQKVFSISSSAARRKVHKYFDTNIHNLRHNRATHLLSDPYNMSIQQVATILGHAGLSNVGRYMHLTAKSIFDDKIRKQDSLLKLTEQREVVNNESDIGGK